MGKHVFHADKEAKYNKFKTIYKDWIVTAVIKNINITQKEYNEFFTKAVAEDRAKSIANNKYKDKAPIRFKIHAKEPFSENEEDYGTKILWPIRIETVVGEYEPSELAVAIKTYKLQFNQ